MSELLPCPFCGHRTPEFERRGTSRQSCIVVCGNCGCRHESSDEDERCGESWNTRAALAQSRPQAALSEEQTVALITECRDALAEELAGWDLDPPLHHVKQAHDKCEAWLKAAGIQPGEKSNG